MQICKQAFAVLVVSVSCLKQINFNLCRCERGWLDCFRLDGAYWRKFGAGSFSWPLHRESFTTQPARELYRWSFLGQSPNITAGQGRLLTRPSGQIDEHVWMLYGRTRIQRMLYSFNNKISKKGPNNPWEQYSVWVENLRDMVTAERLVGGSWWRRCSLWLIILAMYLFGRTFKGK